MKKLGSKTISSRLSIYVRTCTIAHDLLDLFEFILLTILSIVKSYVVSYLVLLRARHNNA